MEEIQKGQEGVETDSARKAEMQGGHSQPAHPTTALQTKISLGFLKFATQRSTSIQSKQKKLP